MFRFCFFVFILIAAPGAAGAEAKGHDKKSKGTICTITINSSEEREVFRKNLGPQGFQIRELIEDSPRAENTQELDSKDWFESACKKLSGEGTHCDALVISGHFGGAFFGSSGKSLSLEQLEKASCSNSCDAVLKDPKAVYLFGCNTLAGKDKDHRTPEEYLQVLLRDGIPRNQAEMVVEERYGATGNTNQDRMRRVFGNTPKIYGFSSVGPSGANVKGMLSKYFKKNPDYSTLLQGLESERSSMFANHTLDQLKNVNSSSHDPFKSCLKKTAVACTSGACLSGKEDSDVHEKLCKIRDDARPLKERLSLLRDLLQQPDRLAYVPTATEVLEGLDFAKLSTGDRGILQEIKNNEDLKSSLMTLIKAQSTTLLTQKMKWIEFSSKLQWLSDAEIEERYQMIGMSLVEKFDKQEDRDTFVGLLFNDAFTNALRTTHEVHSVLVKFALMDSESPARGYAAYSLGMIKPENRSVTMALVNALNDKSEGKRVSAVDALASLNPDDPAVNSALVKALNDSKQAVRVSAADALGWIRPKDSSVISALVNSLNDSDRQVRSSAAYALGKIKPSDTKVKEQVKAAGFEVDW